MQNDFGAEGGMFARAGIDIVPTRKAIEPAKAVLTAARRAGVILSISTQILVKGRSTDCR